MASETYTYETKCRRCGSFHEWYFSDKDKFKWTEFANAMQDHIEHPRQCRCDTCGKTTVQDVVSYTDAHS